MKPSRSCRFQAACCKRNTCSTSDLRSPFAPVAVCAWARPAAANTVMAERKMKNWTKRMMRIEASTSGEPERTSFARGKVEGEDFRPEPRQDLRAALLGRNGLACDRFSGNFPGAFRPIRRRFIVVLKPIVMVGVADRPQRLVVKTRQPKPNLELFGKHLQGFQMVGGRWYLGLRVLQKLLVTTVDQLRDLAADQVTGMGKNLHTIFGRLLNGGRHIVFPEEHPPVGSWRFGYIETVVAQPGQCFLVASCFNRFGHYPRFHRLVWMQLRANCCVGIYRCIDLQFESSKDNILHSVFPSFLHITIVTGEWFSYGSGFYRVGSDVSGISGPRPRNRASRAEFTRAHRKHSPFALCPAHHKLPGRDTFGKG